MRALEISYPSHQWSELNWQWRSTAKKLLKLYHPIDHNCPSLATRRIGPTKSDR